MVGWEGALTGAFIGVLNMSLTACVMVLAVLVIRALLCTGTLESHPPLLRRYM